MSLEQLTNAAVQLQLTASKLDALQNLFGTFPPGQETVFTIGANADFADLKSAWAALKDKPITGPMRLQVLDGTQTYNERVVIGPHPWARNIRIIGNTLNPAMAVIEVGDGPVSDNPEDLWGIHLVGMPGVEMSGFTFRGTGAASTSMGFYARDGSYVYSQPQTMRFENLALGFGVNAASAWRAHQLTTTGCLNAGFAADGGLIQCQLSTFTGQGFGLGVGLKSQDGATVQAYDCTSDGFQFGFFSSSGSHMGVGDSRGLRCEIGFLNRAASLWAHMSLDRVDVGSAECLVGFQSEGGGMIYAENLRSENDRQAIFAGRASSVTALRSRIVQNNTAVIPSYLASAYHIQGDELSMIQTSPTSWQTSRSSSYRSTVATYGRVAT
jgi:hypothetical protein